MYLSLSEIGLKRAASCTAALAAVLAVTPAHAYQDDPGSSNAAATSGESRASQAAGGLEDIVVTAQRREQSLMRVPQAVQALTGEQLSRSGITDLRHAIQMVPGAGMNAMIGAGTSVFQIRGVSAAESNGNATIGYYLDDFAFNLPGLPFAPSANLYDLQRAEVLRGPSGTLYGLGSLGGTIKLLTNDPDTEKLTGSVRVTGSTTAGGRPSGSGDLMLNVPLIEDKLALRGVLSYEHLGGYADNLVTGDKNANPQDSILGRVKLLARPTDELKITLSYWRNKTEQKNGTRLSQVDPPRASIADISEPAARSNYTLYSGTVSYDVGPVELTSSTGYLENTVHFDGRGTIQVIGDFTNLTAIRSKTFVQDVRVVYDSDSNFSYVFGLFYQNGTTDGGPLTVLPDIVTPGNVGIRTDRSGDKLKSRAYAIYGEGTYSFADGLVDLTLGGRYFKEKLRYNANNVLELLQLGLVIPNVETIKETGSTFNPRFNVSVHPNENGLVYAEVAKGFRSGAISSGAITTAANLVLGTNFSTSAGPDTLWNYEVGTKWSLADRKVRLELSLYRFDWKDAQLEISPSGDNLIIPVGDVRAKGIDASISWQAAQGLNLSVTGNLNQTKLRNVPAGITAAIPFFVNGEQLPGTAKKTLAASVSYERSLGQTGYDLRIDGRYTYRSRQQSLFDGSFAPWVGVGGARIGFGDDRFDFRIFAENIANARGPYSKNGGAFVIPYPRQVGVSLEIKMN